MSATARERRRPAGGLALIILGSVLGLVALALLAGGGGVLWADQTQRDSDGYFTSSQHRLAGDAYAITHEGANVSGIPGLIDAGKLARIRIAATSANGRPVFVGIARQRDIDTYLAGVGHSELRDFDLDPFKADYDRVGGTARPAPPGSQHIWVASASSGHSTTLDWRVRSGTWGVVVMNADGSRGVDADLAFGANIGYLGWVWGGLLAGGTVFLGVAVLLVVLGSGGVGGPGRKPATSQDTSVTVTAVV